MPPHRQAAVSRLKFGERAFCYAGPSAWNTLPRQILETVDSATFRKLLKRIILPPPSTSSDFYNSYCFISFYIVLHLN